MRLLLFGVIILLSCNDAHHTLPGYSGSSGELIVVSEDPFWNEYGRDLVDSTLGKPQPCLPQQEPTFRLIHVTPSSFNRVFNTHRNIFIIETNPSFEDSLIVKKNRWANGQIVAQLRAKSPERAGILLNINANKLIASYNQAEVNRLIARNKKFSNGLAATEIQKKYGFLLVLQKDAVIANDSDDDFCWIRWERERPVGGYMHQISQGVLIYSYPYLDSTAFTLPYQMAQRNRITKTYIQGNAPASYMTTGAAIDPISKELNLNGKYALEVRGYWIMKGDYMGGPFVSISLYDEEKKRIVTLDGYVYAPQFDKREYLREMEAVIKSISLSNGNLSHS